MNKNLLIVGAGQYGQVAKEIATDMGIYEKISFLDDNSGEAIGKISDMEAFVFEYQYAIVAIGNPQLRMKLLAELKENGYTIATLVHPKAYVSASAQVLPGCIIEPMAVIQAGSVLNPGVLVSAGAIVNHNSLVMEGCHLDIGSMVKVRSCVPAERKVEAGEVYEGVYADAKEYFSEGVLEKGNISKSGSAGDVALKETFIPKDRENPGSVGQENMAEEKDWIQEQIEKYGKEPNLFDGV